MTWILDKVTAVYNNGLLTKLLGDKFKDFILLLRSDTLIVLESCK